MLHRKCVDAVFELRLPICPAKSPSSSSVYS
jgi:hypothetical protein